MGYETKSPSESWSKVTSAKIKFMASPFWIHFLAGGISGTFSAVITCPLEVVKTRFQSSHYATNVGNGIREISFSRYPMRTLWYHINGTLGAVYSVYKMEGLAALWKGIGATVVGVMPSRAIFFSTYQTSKTFLSGNVKEKERAWIHLTSAFTAGIITSTITNPIWLIKTRMQLQSSTISSGQSEYYKNSLHCLRVVLKKEGIRALYQGMGASYLGAIEGTIQWVIYEKLKKITDQNCTEKKNVRSWVDYFSIAAIAKISACCIAYPHEVLRTRLRQGKSSNGIVNYTGLIQATKKILQEEGVMAFYNGMTAHMMRVVPNAAIMFCCYEFIVHNIQSDNQILPSSS